MEYCLDENCAGKGVTHKDRNILIRYCLSVATRATCSTKALLRPLKQKYLKEAFAEQGEEHLTRIARYEREMREYDPETAQLPQGMLEYFGGVPAKETYAAYCRQIVRQEREVLRSLKRSYSVCVDYAFIGRKLLALHNSLNPRVTFGYSNSLHETCDFALDDEKREAFLNSSLAELPQYPDDWIRDWGNAAFDGVGLVYEDLTLFRGETCILETVSHERMMTVRLEESDLAALAANKDGKKTADRLRRTAQ